MRHKRYILIVAIVISAFLLLGSQNYTSDVYDSSHVAATDLQNMENNFDALKTNFSGASAPSNPSAHQWWADTTNSILKYRNAANTAWIDFFDFSNQVFMAGVDDGLITAAMISDSARKPTIVSGETIAPTTVNATTVNATTLNGTMPFGRTLAASDSATHSNSTTSYVTVGVLNIYLPSSFTNMTVGFDLHNSNASYTGYGRFQVYDGTTTLTSTAVSVAGTPWTHKDITLDCSSLNKSTWGYLYIQTMTDNAAGSGQVKSMSAYWNQ